MLIGYGLVIYLCNNLVSITHSAVRTANCGVALYFLGTYIVSGK